ncbi:hypothetical protein G5C33_04700 [Sphingosinithalassobacter tenebrarum]|uniref:Uncharacterized protein n=1 Tax=Stakelama tenebrarum TaxID=2711215 RepID=A0A6G6YA59_9SPHN|nr:hypothetical protein G5C33_04700 [Sphingosinithalassobacter tenebrarum]
MVLALAAGCSREGTIAQGGIHAVRSACPVVAIPAGTGDITLFDPADSRDASAIDVTATMTNVTSTCNETGEQIVTDVAFEVFARRRDAGAARSVTLPYFITVVRGGESVIAKRVGQVTLDFAAGADRASTSGTASTSVSRAAATLPEAVRDRLTERRRAGEEGAAIDPLSDPAIRQALLAATFEAMVGFQLTEDQLRYNATR